MLLFPPGDENNTMLVMRSVKNTERVFKNATALKVASIEAEQPGKIEAILPYIKGMAYKKSFQETGNTEDSVWSCGQSMGLIEDIPTCKKLIADIVAEAESIIRNRLPKMLTSKL
jgi:NAD(P)H-dependent flavin oxidoreductase YrpB (nitropropane dioxygenase family)